MNNGEAAFPEFNNVYIGPESEERKNPDIFVMAQLLFKKESVSQQQDNLVLVVSKA